MCVTSTALLLLALRLLRVMGLVVPELLLHPHRLRWITLVGLQHRMHWSSMGVTLQCLVQLVWRCTITPAPRLLPFVQIWIAI